MEGRPNASRLFSNRAVITCFCLTPTLVDAARAPPAPARRGQLVAALISTRAPVWTTSKRLGSQINIAYFHTHGHMQPAIFMPARIFLHLYQRECVFVRTLVLQNRVFVYVCMHDYQRLCIRVYVCVYVCVAVDCEYEGEEKSQGGIRHFY
jgi:hypothetical protein